MKTGLKITLILSLLILAVLGFLFYEVGPNTDYVLSKRMIRLSTMGVVGTSVAFSAIIFQTLTNNRILTPSIMGYEAIFILFQTLIVYFYGHEAYKLISPEKNFLYAIGLMMLFSVLMYFLLFRSQRKGLFYLLLTGMVMGTLFHTLSQFLQVLIDPNDFSIIQNYMFVSFSKMNTKLLAFATLTMLGAIAYTCLKFRHLDVLALGRDQAINLGLDYNRIVRNFMVVISILVSVSTALVGPITFLGILLANLTYEIFATRKHAYMLWIGSIVSCVFLIVSQFLVEHVLGFSTTVSIVINFVGGLYFMFLLWKTRKRIS